jgi:hypothetical protein
MRDGDSSRRVGHSIRLNQSSALRQWRCPDGALPESA